MTQLDLDLSQSRRDRGLKRAAEHAGDPWMTEAVEDFARFVSARGEATLEAWRYDWLARGKPSPASHKAYGAVAMSAAKRGLVVNTGRYVKAQSPKTHAHRVPVWASIQPLTSSMECL